MSRDLGNKFTCFKCQTKFYDLKKPAPICPKCGADQREVPAPTTRASKKAAAAAAPASRLEAAGANLTYRESPTMGHSIDPTFLRELPAWIGDTLGVAA